VPIIRDDVSIPSVTSEVFEKNGKNLLYLEVSIISNKTTALLLEEIREALESSGKIDGIILDLR
jgi:C-terminal processing protease CtpA/Prc